MVAHLVSGEAEGQLHARNVLQGGYQCLDLSLGGVREGGLYLVVIVGNVKGNMNTKMKLDNLSAKHVSQATRDFLRGCSSTKIQQMTRTSASNVQQVGLDEVNTGIFQVKFYSLMKICW